MSDTPPTEGKKPSDTILAMLRETDSGESVVTLAENSTKRVSCVRFSDPRVRSAFYALYEAGPGKGFLMGSTWYSAAYAKYLYDYLREIYDGVDRTQADSEPDRGEHGASVSER